MKTNVYLYRWVSLPSETLGYRMSVSIRDMQGKKRERELREIRAMGTEVFCVLPALWCQTMSPEEKRERIHLVAEAVDGFYVGNLGQIEPALATGKPVWGDWGLNITNGDAARCYAQWGLQGMTLATEIQGEETSLVSEWSHASWGKDVAMEVLAEGRVPVMVSEYCPLAGALGIRGSRCGKCRDNATVYLRDFRGERYPVRLYAEDCTSMILSKDRIEATLSLPDHVVRRVCVF